MTTYIIYGLVVVVVLFMGRNYIKGWILERRDRKKKVAPISPDLVYIPIKSSRTFDITIQINELGDGVATIDVIRKK